MASTGYLDTLDEQDEGQRHPRFLDVPGQNIDPYDSDDHRLRIVRTVTNSIHELNREDDRRRVGKRKRGRKPTFKRTLSMFSKSSKGPQASGSHPLPTSGSIASGLRESAHGLNEFGHAEGQAELPGAGQQGNTRTANQEEEAKAEVFTSLPETDQSKLGESRRRRNVYLNLELPMSELDSKTGQPREYSRNKVRTSKYTIWTFLPKNLTEQFRRVANLYFAGLVILQIFPIFGGASPILAMLPLLAILMITAVKDGIEDYRRQQLDEAVNNSAVTRLGNWKNVNVPAFTRGFFAKLFGLGGSGEKRSNASGKVSKGVRKLREKEGEFVPDFLYNSNGPKGAGESMEELDRPDVDENGNIDAFAYPRGMHSTDRISSIPMGGPSGRDRSQSLGNRTQDTHGSMGPVSTRSYLPKGVVDYRRPSAGGSAKWERTLWKKLEVGDVVLLKENDQVPADIVVLSSSDPDGVVFVETKNLDGETNLKPRRSLKATMSIQHEEDVEHSQFVIDSEPPHANLYSYNGVLHYSSPSANTVPHGQEHPVTEHARETRQQNNKEAITINELLLRGCAIRNTVWVIGIVVYTGQDTKIMLNQGETPSKRSKIEKETNFNVIANFVILVGMCIAAAIANGLFLNKTDTSAYYYEQGVDASSSTALNAIVTFGACLIVFQNIVPISLIITVELVKTIQAIFIYQDIDMWYEPLDHPCVPKTWNISDDLGQIEYIFSDKTGTLTQNVMEFKRCSVNGVPYGEGITEAMIGAAKREGRDTSAFDDVAGNAANLQRSKDEMVDRMNTMFKNRYLREDKLTFISPAVVQDLGITSGSQRGNIIQFFRALAICHTVLGDRFDPDNQNLIEYKAESPDESALVAAARDMGFVFLSRTTTEIEIEVMGQPERYTPLRVLEFNSSRKRMSTIVRQADGRILMICKGADSVIYQRLRADHDPELKASTNKDMEDFANSGLRTLCIAYKYLREDEYLNWVKVYDAACSAVEDREDEIEKACEFIEHDLTILGATALEDKLQVGVPDAIAQLHKAGIKLWILTGDKVQTAIEIGFSCNLLTNSMDIMILSSDTEDGARTQIEAGLDKISKARLNPVLAPKDGFAVVIDGETLRYALDGALKSLFLELGTQCGAVVCCRVSPSQKAMTVKLVKDGKNAMTLAIGDGANDVAMIQEAHIGVGIAGLEGAQASMSADYAIGQFRYLTKLLLVHGRWCYIRVADMHANFFYKNIVWVFAMFWYQFFCDFDGGYLFDYTLILLYNVAFTSIPVIMMGAFDQDINARTSMAVPQLYKRGIAGAEYTRAIFWAYILDGLYQSAVVFFIPFIVYNYSTSATSRGYGMDAQVELGTTVAAAAVITVTLFVGLNTDYWTAIMTVVLIVSALLLYIWVAIYSAFPYTFNNLVIILFSTFDFWALIVIVQVVALGPRYLYKYIQTNYFYIDNNIIREAAALGKGRKLPYDDDMAEKQAKQEKQIPVTAPQLDVDVRTSPIFRSTSRLSANIPSSLSVRQSQPEQNLEMSELAVSRRQADSASAMSPGHDNQSYATPPLQTGQQTLSENQYANREDTYEELGDDVIISPKSDHQLKTDSPGYLHQQYYSAHSRGGSNVTSPVHSPRTGSQGGRTPRAGSRASFATAYDEPYSEDEGSEAGYAGYAR